jgi:hypothetical protein
MWQKLLLVPLLVSAVMLTGCSDSDSDEDNDNTQPVAATQAVADSTATPENDAQTSAYPYGIDQRPQPSDTDLEALMPPTVGTFTRQEAAIEGDPTSGEDLYANYTSGSDTIFMGFAIVESVDDAHAGIQTTYDEGVASDIDVSNALFNLDGDPGYFKTDTFMAWSRDNYFYYVDASSPEALDAFMTNFPY